MSNDYIILGLTIAIALFGWLLQQKDTARQADIARLFELHDKDAKRLDEFELDTARRHYVKEELDNRFEKLDRTITLGLDKLGDKMDRLSGVLLKHNNVGE